MTRLRLVAGGLAAVLVFVLNLGLAACKAGDRDREEAAPAARPAGRESLSLSGAWALYPLAVRWQEEFQRTHPGTAIDIQAGGAGKGIADALAGAADIGMVSREIQPAEAAKGAVAVAVAKDAVVAAISRRNPFLDEILRRGLKREDFAAIWIRRTAATWEGLLGRTGRTPVHIYTRSDACGAAETWAAYLGGRQEDLGGIGVYGDPGLAEAVRRDPLAIGFNNVNFAYDAKSLRPVDGIEICPIDLDGSGLVDPAEKVYARRDDLTRAIAAGVYPSPPARDLYFVVRGRPDRPLLAEFLAWVLTEGQAYVPEMGYIGVGPDKIAAGLAAVRGAEKR
ncbi:MAG TPA: substrate-binding domain-containing protein [Candidatus Aminicenantes bacterium]|nr:substrate-binding domain-containing protein [Candidatus Aminicenantes bacterium]HRY64077.1 substrate-binding domain-containing protein [Candidatus Aminicenantes bacterium]HRZ70990.1 substrate-binding domain-containing protein [Candidatus Aminicenantes bacterium]